jgi:hypothetical protein
VVRDDEQTARVLAELGADVPTWRAAQERAASELEGPVDHARMRLATLEVLLATALALTASPPPTSAPTSPPVIN